MSFFDIPIPKRADRLITDEHDAGRACRYKAVEVTLEAALLSIEDRRNFYDGLCSMRVFEGQVILDYTRAWGTPRA